MWITPNYQASDFNWPLSLDDKIKIFVDRTMGWQLDLANKVINGERDDQGNVISKGIPHSGFAVLHIVLSYFEMIAKYRDGFAQNGRSKRFFRKGVLFVFPELQNYPEDEVREVLNAIYEEARCGLYHGGMTGPRIILTGDINTPIAFDRQKQLLTINPHQLVPALSDHFRAYSERLHDPTNIQLRSNFERRFDFDMQQ